MAERPLLVMPVPVPVDKQNKGGGGERPLLPSPTRQRERLSPQFTRIESAFEAKRAQLSGDVAGADPELVLVLKTVGSIEKFYSALRGTNLDWLGEFDVQDIPADQDFVSTRPADTELSGRVYLLLADQRGLKELLHLWRIFQNDPNNARFERGQTKWRNLFRQLNEIRPWGPQDRIEATGLREDWEERALQGIGSVRIEVELWYREDEGKRRQAEATVTRYIQDDGGQVLARASIAEISYHALLARLPIQEVAHIANLEETRLVQCDEVMFFRPAGQAIVDTLDLETTDDPNPPEPPQALPRREPIVALLDGLPLSNHPLLRDRLIVDDPDGWEENYPALGRQHGTAMASLIAHGDLNVAAGPLDRLIYARPIMRVVTPSWVQPQEGFPEDVLLVDLLHRAVRRMKEGDGIEAATAPSVRIVNLSIGTDRIFGTALCPLARLIDYLAHRYNLLFLISAGNHVLDIALTHPRADFATLASDPVGLEKAILQAVRERAAECRLRGPAESVNAVTVGALHQDGCMEMVPPGVFDPYPAVSLPSPISAFGAGFRRAVKPDILLPGGRLLVRPRVPNSADNVILEVLKNYRPPGHKCAAPPQGAAGANNTVYLRGTSNATALASRASAQLYDILEELRAENASMPGSAYDSVLLKALLVHGASWGSLPEELKRRLGEISSGELERMLGYGVVIPNRSKECTARRATFLTAGSLGAEQAHRYRLPIPQCLSGQTCLRRVVITLAWLSPMNSKHRAYRKADLWFATYANSNRREQEDIQQLLRVQRCNVQWQTTRRGTVQHEIFEGARSTSFSENQFAYIQVNCRAEAGELHEAVPYALVFTLEVAAEVNLPIYEEVRARIQPRVEVRTFS